MKWNKFESCLLLVTCCFSLASSQVASESIEEEVCNTNHFRASCADDEVIIVETAQYGRYQLGTCILEGFGYLGCMHDVMLEAESYCSGRRKCEIRVDDTSFPRAAPCHKDLKNHLWISYRCYKVVAPKSHCHPNGNPETVVDLTKLGAPGSGSSRAASARIHGNEDDSDLDGVEEASRPRDAGAYRRERGTSGHLLSSWITEQTGCGTADSPWVVVAGEGQRLNLTLYDFGPEAATPLVGGRADRGRGRHHEPSYDGGGRPRGPANNNNNGGGDHEQANRSADQHVKPTCRVLATVRESPQFRSNTICSGQGRVVNVATSLTNRVELRFLVGRSKGSASTRSGDKGETSAAGGATDDGQQQQQLPADRTKYQLPSHFLFQIKVIGCATPPVLKGTRVNRIGDHVTIDCGSDSGESWQMTCVDGSWTGYYRNCSQDSTSLHSRLEGIMPYATSIVIVGIIAVLMVCFILTAGIFCIKWRLRQDLSRSRYFRPKPSASRDAEYIGYPTGGQQQQQHQQQHLADDRKYPLIPGGAHIGSYYPVMASGSDNLNEYATMRLLQQNEQLMRAGGLARSAAVEPGVSSANVLVVAENYRYPPPPPPQLPQPSIAISSSSSSASKTGAMASFLAASESPQFFGYRSDHVYECPDLVRQEVSRIAAAASCVPASCVQSRDQLAAPTKVECSAVADSSNRNFSL